MRNRSFYRFVFVLMSMLVLMSVIIFAEENTDGVKCPDIVGNKYEAQLREWIDNGFIKGNPDGSFKPDNTVTRAEFMALVNRSFGFTETVEIDFTDVLKENWFYEDAAKAVKAGFMQGYEGKLFPLEPISRQAFATVLSRLTGGEAAADDNVINNLTDSKSIPEWSKAAISTAISKGYFNGLIGDAFKPAEKITRLEAVVALNRAFKSMYKAVYDKGGTYGPAVGIATLDGSAVIISPDVTLRNTTINGDLILRESIGEGNVYLDNVAVKGTTIVRGGGVNSLVIRNSSLGKVKVIREGNTVRIVAAGSTSIEETELKSGAILVEEYLTGDGFGDIVIPDDKLAGANIVFEGVFNNVTVDSGNAKISLASGTIGNLTLAQGGAGTTFNLAQEASVDTLNINAAVNITGQGSIKTANVNVSGSTIQQQPDNVVIAPGTSAIINNQTVTKSMTVAPPKVSSSGGGGGGGGGGGRSGGKSGGGGSSPSKPVIPIVNKDTLKAKISSANAISQNAVIGYEPGEYPPSALYEFLRAIAYAQVVADDANATQVKVDAAVITLNAAIAAFEAAVISEPIPMEIIANLPVFTEGVPAAFTVGTIANDDVGKMVRAYFTLPTGVIVEYQEGGNGPWLPLTDVFGPAAGFPLGDIITTFRGTFNQAGTYLVTVEFREIGTGKLLGSKEISAEVAAVPIVLDSTITQDPGKTGGDATVTIEGKTITFGGEIAYYEEAGGFPPTAGNYVGVEVTTPTGITPSDETILEIDGRDPIVGWDNFKDGDNFFWYYPKVTAAGQEFTFVVKWDGTEATADMFTIKIADNASLEAAPDTTAPERPFVSPSEGKVGLENEETFKLIVDTFDAGELYELEIDHNMEGVLPEFSVYADSDNPYGDDKEEFIRAGVTVDYNAAEQEWTIDFGSDITDIFRDNGGITFYLVIKDMAGNQFGSMYDVTDENTFAYVVSQKAPKADFSFLVP
ncbi:MAG TPA: S-layer homology domain-containing protein [Bacillota bacterium]|nr:S-layer homology domain-containing protein [Bacillota bacterium]